ncbi:MAG: sugar phosphate isomerase/epimerase family protein [Thermomicrobiales bacterium]
MAIKIAISSYSFHRFGGGPEGNEAPSVESMVDLCAEYGVDGIEFLIDHLRLSGKTTPAALHGLRQYMALRGIAPVTIAASHNPVQPTPEARSAELDKLIEAIDIAAELGAPFVRTLGGRWMTITDFQELLANNGEEPAKEGYTLDDSYDWAIEALKAGAYYAGLRGVTLVLENHWGLTGTAAGTARIHDGVGSPWLKYVLDTGNFTHRPDQYAEMMEFFPDLAILHAKVYLGGGMAVTPDIDYKRLAGMLEEIDYCGYVSIEFEGKAHPSDGVPDGIATVREAFGL